MYSLPLNFKEWIDNNREFLKPPVCNKVVWEDAEFIVMVVGGPNSRKDYHVDEGEEFFYQIKGDMLLKIIQNNKVEEINISEGEIFLLPRMIPHSPQRFKDTVGLVIERKRNHGELDGFQWYCDNCNYLLHETFFKLENIVTQLPPLFDQFWSDINKRTCNKCDDVLSKE